MQKVFIWITLEIAPFPEVVNWPSLNYNFFLHKFYFVSLIKVSQNWIYFSAYRIYLSVRFQWLLLMHRLFHVLLNSEAPRHKTLCIYCTRSGARIIFRKAQLSSGIILRFVLLIFTNLQMIPSVSLSHTVENKVLLYLARNIRGIQDTWTVMTTCLRIPHNMKL
jgi:hypothetical protein